MESLVKKGLHLPSLEWLLERQSAFDPKRMRSSPWNRIECADMDEAAKRKLWVEERIKTIGASDVPIIMGTSTYSSPYALACLKMGLVEPDHEETENQAFGHKMEKIAVECLLENVKGEVWDPQSRGFVHASMPFNVATPDRFLVFGESLAAAGGARIPIEIKNVGEYMKDGWGAFTVPDQYYDQVQDQMAATDSHVAILLAIVGGNKFWPYTIFRDEYRIALIERTVTAFWENCQAGILPEPDESEATADALKSRFAQSTGSKKVLTPAAIARVQAYLKAHERIEVFKNAAKAMEERKGQAANWLREFMGDAAEAKSGNLEVTWKNGKRKTRDEKAEAENEELQAAIATAKRLQESMKVEVPTRTLLVKEKKAEKA